MTLPLPLYAYFCLFLPCICEFHHARVYTSCNKKPAPIDAAYESLGAALVLLDKASEEYKMVQAYTDGTQGTRKCRVQEVFKVCSLQGKDRSYCIARGLYRTPFFLDLDINLSVFSLVPF
jgi:hypothetical protein